MAAKKSKKLRGTIKVGVVGIGRGRTFMRGAIHGNMKLVALCDTWEEPLRDFGRQYGVATCTEYEKFLEHDMDAVVLANFFHEHAPFAVKALEAGKHVMSECAACHTLAEGVALVRAVEKSGLVYMFAENYPYSAYNQEMRRLYRKGAVGEFRYGEGEYVHPGSAEWRMSISVGADHWRNWLPSTYYCTHSIAPVMYITDTWPVSVSAFVIPYDRDDPTVNMTAIRHDVSAPMLLRMDNGAVMKSLHGGLRGHGNFVRIHGNRGMMENCRHGDRNMLRVRREPFEKSRGEPTEIVYKPDFPVHHEKAMRAGHSGGDFFMNYHFARAIRTGERPYLDVYRGVAMSICGVQGWRSALAGGTPMPVPDFRGETDRRKYARDDWSPDPTRKGKRPPTSILGKITPSRKAMAFSRKVWARQRSSGV
jgi:predicted dehydrogenase